MVSKTRKKWREENQEDIEHVLEEIWNYHPDDTLYKIFSAQAKCRINLVMNFFEEFIDSLRQKEDNDDISPLTEKDTNNICSLKSYIAFLHFKGDFPSEASDLRNNSPRVTCDK